MNLYNKIYKAINEGIQKALLINPEQNDVSINYSYHKIDNIVIDENKFNRLIKEFIENPTLEKYNILLIYSMEGIYQYKVNNFNELSDIFNKIQNITNDIDLSWVNTFNVLTFIMNDNSELSLNEIDNKNNIMFIKFNHSSNFDHPIIIHKNLLMSDKVLTWSKEKKNIKQLDNKNNGSENTEIIKNEADKKLINLNYYPAFEYCINLKKDPNLKLLNYEGYLPAINELDFLSKNISLINYILKYISGEYFKIKSANWWSSTQFNSTGAWYLGNGSPCYYFDKFYYRQVLPFFTKN